MGIDASDHTSRRWGDHALVLLLLLLSSRIALINFYDAFFVSGLAIAFLVWLRRSHRLSVGVVAYAFAAAVWILFEIISYQGFSARTLNGHVVRLGIGIFAAMALRGSFFELFPLWVARLSIIGLPLFLVGALFPDIVHYIYDALPEWTKLYGGLVVDGHVTSGWRRASLLVYTISPDRSLQNHGFMWEPAAYAMMTVSALALRISGGKTRMDWINATLLIASFSTISTTAYVGVALVGIYWMVRRGFLSLALALAAIPVVLLAFLNADFLLPKSTSEIGRGYSASMRWSLSRYASFVIDQREFLQRPVLGSGIFDAAHPLWGQRLPSNNGLSDYLVRFGLLWAIINFSLVWIAAYRRPRSNALDASVVVGILLVFGWSEKFFELPFFFTLQFLALLPRDRLVRRPVEAATLRPELLTGAQKVRRRVTAFPGAGLPPTAAKG